MSGLEDEKIALQSIYGDELVWHSNNEVIVTVCANATLHFYLPPDYPHERPCFSVVLPDLDGKLCRETAAIIDDEIRQQSHFNLYKAIEAARSFLLGSKNSLQKSPNAGVESVLELVANPVEYNCRETSTQATEIRPGLLSLSTDVLEKVFSWLDVERDLLRVSLVNKLFAACFRSNNVWDYFWQRRWGSAPLEAREELGSRSAYQSRFACEARWETDGGRPHIKMFKIAEDNASICRMCWVRQLYFTICVACASMYQQIYVACECIHEYVRVSIYACKHDSRFLYKCARSTYSRRHAYTNVFSHMYKTHSKSQVKRSTFFFSMACAVLSGAQQGMFAR
jgi:hypothetical protein